MSLTKTLLLYLYISLYSFQANAQDSKSFDESFKDVQSKASTGQKQSADKINEPKKVEPAEDVKSKEENSNTLIIVVALALVFGGWMIGKASMKRKTPVS